MNKTTLVAALATLALLPADAKVTLATPFNDKAVLQRRTPVPVWGWADPGEKVTVSFAGNTASATAGADGKWMVKLPAMEASSENRVLKANDVEVKDVLVGEVWFCAGQSNTELPLVASINPHFVDREGKMVSQLVHEKTVRYAYCSNYRWSVSPKEKFDGPFTAWKEFIPENLRSDPSFSAMGVYFALQLHETLDIPIGIVGTYWGGTNIDAWTPRSGYEGMPSLKATADFKVVDDAGWRQEMAKPPISGTIQQPTVLWNEMVAPWVPFAAKGLIWYQGCHNSAEGALYCDKMHALYNGWSKEFKNPDFKLYFVQLAPWSSSWWDIELAQEKFADEEPNAGMTVTCDIGNNHDIHPNEKGTVGRRLAALALSRDYGFSDIVADYPRVVSAKALGREVTVKCSNVNRWELYNADWGVQNGFELKAPDGSWKKARILNCNKGARGGNPWYTRGEFEGREIHLVCDEIDEPKGVRYLHEFPWAGYIYADSGLPLAAFIREW